MLPRLVPEISPLDAFCDVGVGVGVVVGIGDSRSWMEVRGNVWACGFYTKGHIGASDVYSD